MIRLEGVSKSFGTASERQILFEGISLQIHPGEFVALTGPSGCGKSTLLNIMGGLDHPDDGRVFVDDTRLDTLGPNQLADLHNRLIGFIFQDHYLFSELTVRANVMLPMRIAHTSKSESRTRAESLLTSLGLSSKFNQRPIQLSYGERQRVAIARALANKPKVLFADEPTGSLHPAQKESIFFELLTLSRQEQVTVVMVTHDLALISEMHGGSSVDRQINLQDYIWGL